MWSSLLVPESWWVFNSGVASSFLKLKQASSVTRRDLRFKPRVDVSARLQCFFANAIKTAAKPSIRLDLRSLSSDSLGEFAGVLALSTFFEEEKSLLSFLNTISDFPKNLISPHKTKTPFQKHNLSKKMT